MTGGTGGGGGGGGRAPREANRVEVTINPYESTPIWEGPSDIKAVWLEDGSALILRGIDHEPNLQHFMQLLRSIPVEVHRVPDGLYLPKPLAGDSETVYLHKMESRSGKEPILAYLVLDLSRSGWVIYATTKEFETDP